MNIATRSTIVVMVSALLAVFALGSSTDAPHPAASEACEAASAPAGLAATPQCNYLAKCCAGNTPNAPKCCQAYFSKCGKDGS